MIDISYFKIHWFRSGTPNLDTVFFQGSIITWHTANLYSVDQVSSSPPQILEYFAFLRGK